MGWSLCVRGLSWDFGGPFALRAPALDLRAGTCTAIIGPSGGGKSTLLAVLGRVEHGYFPTHRPGKQEGSIVLTGPEGPPLELLGASEATLRAQRVRGQRLGFVFQREGLFDAMSVLENLSWPLRENGKDKAALEIARQWAHRVQLECSREVHTLSGGERKRLAIARALALEPGILLLDEPLTGLDPASMAALRAVLLDALRRGTALAMVTHQREDVEALATHVAVVRQGAVEVTGTVQECHEALLQHWEPPSVRLRATTVTPKSLAGDQGADP